MSDTLDILYKTNLLNTNIKELKTNKCFNQNNFFIVEDYLNDYNNHLKDVERDYKNRKNIKCIKLEITFEFTKSKNYLKSITNKVIEYFTTSSYYLPYISFSNGNCNQLILILFDRYFYPKGKEVNIVAKSDFKNGKYKLGDVVTTKKIYISHKIRIFNFATVEQLKKYFEILRLYLTSNNKDIDKQTISDKQYINKGGKHYKRKRKDLVYEKMSEYRMRKIRAYNTLIRESNIKMISLSQEVLTVFKKRIHTPYDVFEFEQQMYKCLELR